MARREERRVTNRNGEEGEVEQVVVAAEGMKCLGVQEVGPPAADEREGSKSGVGNSGEAIQENVVREGGNGGGDCCGGGGGDGGIRLWVVGVLGIGETRFHEPGKVARVATIR